LENLTICGKVLHLPVEKLVENFGSNFIKQFKFSSESGDKNLSCAKAEKLSEKIFPKRRNFLKIFKFLSKIHSIFEKVSGNILENNHRKMPTLKFQRRHLSKITK